MIVSQFLEFLRYIICHVNKEQPTPYMENRQAGGQQRFIGGCQKAVFLLKSCLLVGHQVALADTVPKSETTKIRSLLLKLGFSLLLLI